jgi:hypothetical protein
VYAQISKVVAGPWQLATGEDRRWPATEGAVPLPLPMRMLQQYAGQVLRTALNDATVSEAFNRVQQMVAPPTLFFRPDIVLRVLANRLRRRKLPPPAVEPGSLLLDLPLKPFTSGIREISPSRNAGEPVYKDD